MTTFEHAMVGACAVMAAGMHQRCSWKLVVLAAVAAVAPDWDGITVLFDASLFDQGHRVWGHNIFACCLLGGLLAAIDYRLDITGRVTAWMATKSFGQSLRRRASIRITRSAAGWLTWILVGMLAALTQIPTDAVVSGGQGLGDWPVQYLWPLSDQSIVCAMVPWGAPDITIIFSMGMLAAARCPAHLRRLAAGTLGVVIVWIVLRGTLLA